MLIHLTERVRTLPINTYRKILYIISETAADWETEIERRHRLRLIASGEHVIYNIYVWCEYKYREKREINNGGGGGEKTNNIQETGQKKKKK